LLRYLRIAVDVLIRRGIAIEVLLIGVVAFTCLSFGGTPRWTWTVLEIGVGLAAILWVARMGLAKKLSYVKTPLNLLLVLLLIYIFLQVVPIPSGILRAFQSNTPRRARRPAAGAFRSAWTGGGPVRHCSLPWPTWGSSWYSSTT
jgi:hypothetical protein